MTTDNLPEKPLWKDPDQPIDARVADLVSRMTLDEKALQMLNDAPAVERIGLPAYNWWNECLHGVARAGLATVFPQAIGMAAMWDRRLMRKIGDVVSTEARAKHHQKLREGGNSLQYWGLTFWTPNINIFRDPRWGRGQETYGECPYLTAETGVQYVKGLQGDDPKYLKVAACAKHFAVHSGPEKDRHGFDARVSLRDLWETYLPAFEALVRQGRVASVMGAYNRTNGEPCCASPTLLGEILRKQWKFAGHVMSDCGAICDIYQQHKMVETAEEASALAVNAGCDLNCGQSYQHLAIAVGRKLISEQAVNTAVSRLMRDRFRLGMFDPPDRVPYAAIPAEANDCPAHSRVALRAARESMVLLKNDGVLPLDPAKVKTLAVIGPAADDLDVLLGNYNGVPSDPITMLRGLRQAFGKSRIFYVKGCSFTTHILEGGQVQAAVQAAAQADAVVMCMGLSPAMEGEEGQQGDADRTTLDLPQVQDELLQAVASTGKPMALVLTGGSCLAVNWAAEHVPAILMAWYPGQAGGQAVADVICGKYNPAGRLPVTFYKSVEQLPPFADYAMKERTYRFFTGRPLYPFGHGLSYTRFEYSNLRVPRTAPAGKSVKLSVDVANVGERAGDEVVQAYVSRKDAAVPVPLRELAAFERITLKPGQKKTVSLTIQPRQLACVMDDGRRVVEPGRIELAVGGGQPGYPGSSNVLAGQFELG